MLYNTNGRAKKSLEVVFLIQRTLSLSVNCPLTSSNQYTPNTSLSEKQKSNRSSLSTVCLWCGTQLLKQRWFPKRHNTIAEDSQNRKDQSFLSPQLQNIFEREICRENFKALHVNKDAQSGEDHRRDLFHEEYPLEWPLPIEFKSLLSSIVPILLGTICISDSKTIPP